MTGSDHPIALRPLGDYPARQASVFEDPGDEKSWHRSQRSESLEGFYEGREPSWYASAIKPLAGAARVLDLGCGPGLTLRALREAGATSVLGIDRWPGFASGDPEIPVALHDLTLPMPFLPSGSFDAVLSHYALDYVSPIGMRQVLREARRVLAPGGRLLIYVAGIGLGSGDETRTSPYAAATMRALLEEAGFAELDVEPSPNGRNTVASAGRGPDPIAPPPAEIEGGPGLDVEIDGEAQVCAAFEQAAGGGSVEVGVGGSGGNAVLSLRLPAGELDRTSVCARVLALGGGRAELQAWVWRGREPVATESVRLELEPRSLTVSAAGLLDLLDAWSPRPLSVEPNGCPYIVPGDLRPGAELSEAERGDEGRAIVVEPGPAGDGGLARVLGPGANRFLVRRPEGDVALAGLESDWRAGRILGVVLTADRLLGGEDLAIALWAASRQAMLFVEGSSWESIAEAIEATTGGRGGPAIAVDPALTGGEPAADAGPVAALADRNDRVFCVLAPGTAPPPAGAVLGGETLRYLTERTLLMRLRHSSGRDAAELGRRPSLR